MKSDFNKGVSLDPDRIPAHVGIIMDGNGRWAKKKLMNRVKGHEKGSKVVRTIVKTSVRLGIKVLTLYAFSTENWARPKAEIAALMKLLKHYLVSERDEFHANGIKVNIIGQKHRLPADVQKEMDETINLTKDNSELLLNLALSYGSREELTSAVKNIAGKAKSGKINPEDITPETISEHLYTSGMPDPDIIIRTSGEYRLSNFLMWQAAYSEIYISQTLWPDFSEEEYLVVLKDFQNRDRRFGKISCSTSRDG